MQQWVCSDCDETWPATAFGAAFAHTGTTSKQGAKHTIRGLIDVDTGEVVIEGLNKKQAQALGIIPPDKARGGTSERDEATDKDSPIRRGPKDAMAPSVVNSAKSGIVAGTIKGATIEFPLYMPSYWSIGMQRLTDPDTGEPYPATAEGMAKYVVDFNRMAHEKMMWKFLGMAAEEARTEQGQARLEAVLRTLRGLTDDQVATLVRQNLGMTEEVPA